MLLSLRSILSPAFEVELLRDAAGRAQSSRCSFLFDVCLDDPRGESRESGHRPPPNLCRIEGAVSCCAYQDSLDQQDISGMVSRLTEWYDWGAL